MYIPVHAVKVGIVSLLNLLVHKCRYTMSRGYNVKNWSFKLQEPVLGISLKGRVRKMDSIR